MSVEMVSDHRPVYICVCVSSCDCTGVSDVARSRARGLGLVNFCPRLPAPHLRLLWALPGPWTVSLFRAGLGVLVPALWAVILGGPSHGMVTMGEGMSLHCAGTLGAHGLLTSAHHSRGLSAGAGCPLCQCLIT